MRAEALWCDLLMIRSIVNSSQSATNQTKCTKTPVRYLALITFACVAVRICLFFDNPVLYSHSLGRKGTHLIMSRDVAAHVVWLCLILFCV